MSKVCSVLQALYGCVQASTLWFDKLIKFLRKEGYDQSLIDLSVMQWVVGEIVWLLLIYVDVILLTVDIWGSSYALRTGMSLWI